MKKLIKSIIHNWYIYLTGLIVAIFVIDYSLTLLYMPRNEETFTMFLALANGDVTLLNRKLNNKKPDYLRELNTYGVKHNSDEFERYFKIYGHTTSDVVILPKYLVEEENVVRYYTPITNEIKNEYFKDYSFYKSGIDNNNYGVLLHSVGQKNNDVLSYYDKDFDDEYYAFFMKGSKHIGKLNNVKWTTAFDFVKLIKYYEKN